MNEERKMDLFSLKGKNAVLLGGGVLGMTMAKGLAQAGANIAVCDLIIENANKVMDEIKVPDIMKKPYKLDAMNSSDLKLVCNDIVSSFGNIDILVNAVGGNMKDATTSDTKSFFDLSAEALENVMKLNLMAGAILPSQVFGRVMAENPKGGVIINVSSMNAFRPLTRIPGYSAAKAAVSNFTQWLSTDLAKAYGEKMRVNAIAPGFFLTEQNRFLLTEPETGNLTARGKTILDHTPMGRFGLPEDLIGTLVWLASDASKFVTGIVVPVDGGFSAFSGV
jgi:NAD(P)-dependent dehydrogenase (short-subunit alcohol dehydrogenase family)